MTGIATVSTFKPIILMMLLSISSNKVNCSDPAEDTVVIMDENRSETRRRDGTVEGSYSHVDSNGVRRRTEYRVGPNGHEVAGVHEPFVLIANPVRSNDHGPPGAISTSSDHHQVQIPSVEDLIRYTYRLD